MNRFFDVEQFCLAELMPSKLKEIGYSKEVPLFVLNGAVRFRSDIADGVIVIPDQMRTDLASIPQFAWSIFMTPDDPRISAGSLVHDYLYANQGKVFLECGFRTNLTREQCDRILAYECMPDLGASSFQQFAVFKALRWFGDRWK